ncbi:hypothetical protein [Clostridium saccharoperbutylacetonicum]|uniref:hypothetical protein n=1 Tax=Clostridium saccharoperbutylacetonicum TaxID=36745 RepID=UPI0039ED3DFF
MGYQESYVRVKNKDDFNKLIEVIRKIGKNYYQEGGAYPVEIITLKQPIQGNLEYMCKPNSEYKFEKDEKFIYFVGERNLQRSIQNLLNNETIEGVEIYFTECFPSDKIFEERDNEYAIHEEFIWDNHNDPT